MNTPSHHLIVKKAFQCVLALLLSCIAIQNITAQELTKIEMKHNLPLVKGSINDKEAWFIIDTGASATLLNTEMADYFGFVVVQNEYWENYTVTGLGGRHFVLEARKVTVQLGDQKLGFINKSCSLKRISQRFASDNIKIAGIIGSDVMGFLGSQINFRSGFVMFYDKPVIGEVICRE